MKYLIFSIIFAVSSVGILSADETNLSNPVFKLGIIIPLSGDLAEYGTSIRNGFELARSEKPEKFSKINFVYEDSRYDGKTAAVALQNLSVLHAINLYYIWGVSPTEAVLPIAHAKKLPVLAETTVKEATVGKPLVVRAARTGERIANALAQEIDNRGIKSVSLIVTSIPFYTDIIKHLELDLKTRGIKVSKKDEVDVSQADFKPLLWKKKSHQDEAIGVFLLPAQLLSFYRQADQMKLKVQTFNADLLDSETLVSECPDSINGTFFDQIRVTDEFRKLYISKYGNDIQIGSAAQSYDIGMLVADLFGKMDKKLTAEEVIERVSKMSPRQGATGQFKFTDTRDSGKEIRMPVSMKEVKGKKIVTLREDTGY